MSERSVWERLREAQDELDDARAVRPTRCGSEEMQRDELAGDALPLSIPQTFPVRAAGEGDT